MEQPNTDVIFLFHRIHAIWYADVLDQNEETQGLNYESIIHMKYHILLQQEKSVEFFKRTQSSVLATKDALPFKI